MLHAITHLVLETPLLLLLLLVGPLWIFRERFSAAGWQRAALFASLAGVGCLLALSGLNSIRPGFLWGDEQNILGIAAAWVRGEPMYLSRSAASLYSLLYGPYTFMLYGEFLRFSSLQALKLLLVVAHVGIVAGMYALLRTSVDRITAISLLGFGVMCLLPQGADLFGLRADCWLLLALLWAMVLALRAESTSSAIAVGLLLGIAVDFKMTVLFVVAGTLAIVSSRKGWRGLLLACAGFLFAAVLPFLTPGVSLRHYLDWLSASGKQGFETELLIGNLLFAGLLLAPPLLLRLAGGGRVSEMLLVRYRAAGVLFAMALVVAVVTGSKSGAGAWHLWPLLPVSMAWLGDEASRAKLVARGAGALVATSLAAGVVNLRYLYRNLPNVRTSADRVERDRRIAEEVQRIASRYPNHTLAMGYGSQITDERSSQSYLLILQGQEYVVDVNAAAETAKERGSLPPALVQRMLGCGDLWLIPHGEVPFSTETLQHLPWVNDKVFPDAIREGFPQGHRVLAAGEFVDVWGCPAGQ